MSGRPRRYAARMAFGLDAVQWGNVPSWIGSVLTSTSLLMASFSYRHSVAERTRAQADRESSQAAKVSTWMVSGRQARISNANEVAVVIRAFVVLPDDATT